MKAMETIMQYNEFEALREKLSKLQCNKNTNSIINAMDKVDLSESEQSEVLLFIKSYIPQIFTTNDKLNLLNNLLWGFLQINKIASEELKLTTDKNKESRFKKAVLDQNLCCLESFEKRIKENGKFKSLEEYANEMYKKYGVDVIEYCEYDSAMQINKNETKYIEKHQEESDNYVKKISYMKDENFNSFFRQKPIYGNYTDRPLLAVISQQSIYLEVNSLELPKNLHKIIDTLLAGGRRIQSMCDMTKHYKTEDINDSVSKSIYRKQLIDESSKNFVFNFQEIQTIFQRRTIITEVFQCLICYLLMYHYRIKHYSKAIDTVNYLLMQVYIGKSELFCNEQNESSIEILNGILIHGKSTVAKRIKLIKIILKTLHLEKTKKTS